MLDRWLMLGVLATCSLANPTCLRGQDAPAEPAASFHKDVRPILQRHCYGCHQPAKQSGGYVMSEFAGLLRGGESGEAVKPGDPSASGLIQQITPTDGKAEMPKDKPPLSTEEIAVIARWIKQGGANDSPASAADHITLDKPPVYEAPPVITALDFSPDGTKLAISGYHETVIRSADGQQVIARLVGMSERIESAMFSPDGKLIAIAGGSPGRFGELQIWELEPLKLRHTLSVGYDTLYGASWSPDGTKIAFGCPDKSTRAVDAASGEQLLFNGAHDDWVLDTVWSVKGDHLVTVSRDQSMKLVNVATQRFIDNITSITPGALKGGLNSVDRRPAAEELLCGGSDGTPKIYKMFRDQDRKIGDDFNLIRAFEPMEGRVFDVTFNLDGQRIAACSSLNGRGEVRVYEVVDGKLVSSCKVDTGLYSVAFQPDGLVVATGGFDGLVRLVDVASGQAKSSFTPIDLTPPPAVAPPAASERP